jgi:3-hydroxyisobutyrate dehydrogenase-like beta-hydroxyacid dehydrogenase
MGDQKVGMLHPGAMGAFVAASAKNSGCEVYWTSENRSPQTRGRAEKVGLREVRTLVELCDTCPVLVSVCPPHAAEEVADQVLAQGFNGLYVDANAISPQWVIRIGEKMADAGVSFVDGGIIGGPAWESGQTRLYLSGERAHEIEPLSAAGPLQIVVLGDRVGDASAIKMCYAAWTKGSTALLCAILATAGFYGVWPELQEQWERDWPGFPDQAVQRARRVTAKAWRFAGEMEEIASTFAASGLPGGFHLAAADLYGRMAGFKDAPSLPPLEEVLSALLMPEED